MQLGVGIAEPIRFRRPPEPSAVHARVCDTHTEARGLPPSSMTRSPLRPDELLGFRLAQLTRRLLEYSRCKLHWFEVDSPVLAHPGRDVLQTLERLQGEGDETPFRDRKSTRL